MGGEAVKMLDCHCSTCEYGYVQVAPVTTDQLRRLRRMFKSGEISKPPNEQMTWHEAAAILRKASAHVSA